MLHNDLKYRTKTDTDNSNNKLKEGVKNRLKYNKIRIKETRINKNRDKQEQRSHNSHAELKAKE